MPAAIATSKGKEVNDANKLKKAAMNCSSTPIALSGIVNKDCHKQIKTTTQRTRLEAWQFLAVAGDDSLKVSPRSNSPSDSYSELEESNNYCK